MKITYVSDRFVWKHPGEILPFFESMEIFERERGERERGERERDRQTDRQTDRQRETERDRERQREAERDRDRERFVSTSFSIKSSQFILAGYDKTNSFFSESKSMLRLNTVLWIQYCGVPHCLF